MGINPVLFGKDLSLKAEYEKKLKGSQKEYFVQGN